MKKFSNLAIRWLLHFFLVAFLCPSLWASCFKNAAQLVNRLETWPPRADASDEIAEILASAYWDQSLENESKKGLAPKLLDIKNSVTKLWQKIADAEFESSEVDKINWATIAKVVSEILRSRGTQVKFLKEESFAFEVVPGASTALAHLARALKAVDSRLKLVFSPTVNVEYKASPVFEFATGRVVFGVSDFLDPDPVKLRVLLATVFHEVRYQRQTIDIFGMNFGSSLDNTGADSFFASDGLQFATELNATIAALVLKKASGAEFANAAAKSQAANNRFMRWTLKYLDKVVAMRKSLEAWRARAEKKVLFDLSPGEEERSKKLILVLSDETKNNGSYQPEFIIYPIIDPRLFTQQSAYSLNFSILPKEWTTWLVSEPTLQKLIHSLFSEVHTHNSVSEAKVLELVDTVYNYALIDAEEKLKILRDLSYQIDDSLGTIETSLDLDKTLADVFSQSTQVVSTVWQ